MFPHKYEVKVGSLAHLNLSLANELEINIESRTHLGYSPTNLKSRPGSIPRRFENHGPGSGYWMVEGSERFPRPIIFFTLQRTVLQHGGVYLYSAVVDHCAMSS